jgi:hypothetical protein
MMKIDSEIQVIQEAELKTFACGSAIVGSSLATEWVKGKTSRKRLPSRTRISSVSSAFPRATLLDVTRCSRIRRRLHLVGLLQRPFRRKVNTSPRKNDMRKAA